MGNNIKIKKILRRKINNMKKSELKKMIREEINLLERRSDNNLEIPERLVKDMGKVLKSFLEKEVNTDGSWFTSEPWEIESKSRDGFWASTDGGVECKIESTLNQFTEYPSAMEKEVEKNIDYTKEIVADELKDKYPEISDIKRVNYGTLSRDFPDIAEEYDERVEEYLSDDSVTIKCGIYYYGAEGEGKGEEYMNVFVSGQVSRYQEDWADETDFDCDLNRPKDIIKNLEKSLNKLASKNF